MTVCAHRMVFHPDEPISVLDKQTSRADELVRLHWHHSDRQGFLGEIGPWQIERFNRVWIV